MKIIFSLEGVCVYDEKKLSSVSEDEQLLRLSNFSKLRNSVRMTNNLFREVNVRDLNTYVSNY